MLSTNDPPDFDAATRALVDALTAHFSHAFPDWPVGEPLSDAAILEEARRFMEGPHAAPFFAWAPIALSYLSPEGQAHLTAPEHLVVTLEWLLSQVIRVHVLIAGGAELAHVGAVLDDELSTTWEQGRQGEALENYRREVYEIPSVFQPDRVPGDEDAQRRGWWEVQRMALLAENGAMLPAFVRLSALGRLVTPVRWSLSTGSAEDYAARKALAIRADEHKTSPNQEKQQALVNNAPLVLGHWEEAQRKRYGRGEGSRYYAGVPRDLAWFDARTWFYDELRRAAQADLLDQSYPATSGDKLSEAMALSDEVAEPVEIPPVENELDTLEDPRLLSLLAQSLPEQRQLLSMLAQGQDTGEIAQALGKEPNAVYQARARLKKKGQQIQRNIAPDAA